MDSVVNSPTKQRVTFGIMGMQPTWKNRFNRHSDLSSFNQHMNSSPTVKMTCTTPYKVDEDSAENSDVVTEFVPPNSDTPKNQSIISMPKGRLSDISGSPIQHIDRSISVGRNSVGRAPKSGNFDVDELLSLRLFDKKAQDHQMMSSTPKKPPPQFQSNFRNSPALYASVRIEEENIIDTPKPEHNNSS